MALRAILLTPKFYCAAAGMATALSLPKPGVCHLAWFAPAALFYFSSEARKTRDAAVLGWLFGAGYFFVQSFWIYTTCRFAGVPLPASAAALLALTVLMGSSWALLGAAIGRSGMRLPEAAKPWAWAACWTAIESAGAHFTPRLGGDLLAYTQWRWLPMLQIGALLGPHALGWLIAAFSAALSRVFLPGRESVKRWNLALAGGLVVLNMLYGACVLAGRETPLKDGARVEILQPNIDQYQKWDESFESAIRSSFDGLLAQPREAAADLILWPESALPGWFTDPRHSQWVSQWSRKLGAPMLVGALARERGLNRNAALFVDRNGTVSGGYFKRILVPFGEFVPLRPVFQPMIGILAQMGDFARGEAEQDVLKTPLGPLAASICYEAVFPHLLRRDAARGARVFANLTNDGWYKDTAGPYQHFRTNVFRAIENRVFLVRSGNTGISAVIDPYGVVLARTNINERGRLDFRLPAEHPFPAASPFARTGDLFGFAMMAVAAWALWARREA